MNRPRIGITTSYENRRQSVDHHYLEAIASAGGLPMIVPMFQDEALIREFASLVDGLVITGGPGVVKGLIGELPEDLLPVDVVRDTADTLVFNALQDRPVLGICYGMQFINAQAGGTIYADVNQQKHGANVHSPKRGGTEHEVHLLQNSRLRDALGKNMITVNTYHIQAVAEVGSGLRVVGTSPDGVIEAIESTDGRLIGVQFHPERMLDQTHALFERFVAQCRG